MITHLTKSLPNQWEEAPTAIDIRNPLDGLMYWAGIRGIYDRLAGSESKNSYHLGVEEVLTHLPFLNREKLLGARVFFDARFNDARSALIYALTGLREGVDYKTYHEVTDLIVEDGRVVGFHCVDVLNPEGDPEEVRASVVVNATGSGVDVIRWMADPDAESLVEPSSGTHIMISGDYTPGGVGLVTKTSDNRVLYMHPYNNYTRVGTTDHGIETTLEEDVPEIVGYLNEGGRTGKA